MSGNSWMILIVKIGKETILGYRKIARDEGVIWCAASALSSTHLNSSKYAFTKKWAWLSSRALVVSLEESLSVAAVTLTSVEQIVEISDRSGSLCLDLKRESGANWIASTFTISPSSIGRTETHSHWRTLRHLHRFLHQGWRVFIRMHGLAFLVKYSELSVTRPAWANSADHPTDTPLNRIFSASVRFVHQYYLYPFCALTNNAYSISFSTWKSHFFKFWIIWKLFRNMNINISVDKRTLNTQLAWGQGFKWRRNIIPLSAIRQYMEVINAPA